MHAPEPSLTTSRARTTPHWPVFGWRVGPAASTFFIVWAALLIALHLSYGLQFPVPWEDEVHFLVPAANLALAHDLSAPQMLNANGIFWMPSVMYLVDAAVFKLTGSTSIFIGRWISFVEVFGAALCLRLAISGLLRPGADTVPSAWAIAAWWSLAVPVQMAANFARPDALSMLLALAALAATVGGRPLMVVGLAGIGLTTHPLQAAPSLVLAVLACLRWRGHRPGALDRLVAAMGIGALAFELQRLAMHHDTYIAHFAMQLQRKASRGLNGEIILAGVALSIAVSADLRGRRNRGFTATADPRDHAMAFVAAGCAYLFVYAYGREMAYTYALYTGAFLVLAGGWALAVDDRHGPQHTAIAPLAAFVLFIAASWGKVVVGKGWSTMDVTPAGIERLAAEQRWLRSNPLINDAMRRPDTIVDPFLYPLIARDFGPGRPLTYSPLSEPPGGSTPLTVVTAPLIYPAGKDRRPFPTRLFAGYTCTAIAHLASPGHLYAIDLRKLRASDRSAPYEDCSS